MAEPTPGQHWSGTYRASYTYTRKQHLAEVARDAERMNEEARERTRQHIERMQAHLEGTGGVTFTSASLVSGGGRTLATRWTGELDANTRERQERETEAQRANEANLVPGMRCPQFITIARPGVERCNRAIPHPSTTSGRVNCSRTRGHEGRHIAVGSPRTITGLSDRLSDPAPTIKPKTAPRTSVDSELDRIALAVEQSRARHDAAIASATGTPVSIVEVTDAKTGKVTGRYKGGRRIPDAPPEPQRTVVEVGKPCPADIPLSQGQDRCLFGGAPLDDLLCSRTTGHDGNHIATAGDVSGAEVLAVCAE